jgi:dTDP-4-dehydrorhamnose 3,5-epimerase
VFYKVTEHYSPAHDLGIAWDDPDLAISWPFAKDKVAISEKDSRQPTFKSLPTYF